MGADVFDETRRAVPSKQHPNTPTPLEISPNPDLQAIWRRRILGLSKMAKNDGRSCSATSLRSSPVGLDPGGFSQTPGP